MAGIAGRPDVWVTMSAIVISRPLNDGTGVPGGSNLAMGSLSAIFAARDEFGKQRGGHGLGDGADLERRVLIVGTLGIRIRAVIGRRDRAVVYHAGRDTRAGAIALETLLECRTHIVVADGIGGRCARYVPLEKQEEMPSWSLAIPTSETTAQLTAGITQSDTLL